MRQTSRGRRKFCREVAHGSAALFLSSLYFRASAQVTSRPNILWLTYEDSSPILGCYGHPHIHTPVVDKLASEGILFTNAFTTHSQCAPARATLISGLYPSSVGTHHMRCGATAPRWLRSIPQLLEENGYYCTNKGKTDYQGLPGGWDVSSDTRHWRNRPAGKPFFSVFNLFETHESCSNTVASNPRPCPHYPPFYPDTSKGRGIWEHIHQLMENELEPFVEQKLRELDEDGLAEDTIVFLFADGGQGLPRFKRDLYDSGIQVPLIIRIPEKFRAMADAGVPGTRTDELVSFVDFLPTMCNLTGTAIPPNAQGRAFLGPHRSEERQYIHATRDRVGERYDVSRATRDKRYKYIRNYEPWVEGMQFTKYREGFTPMRHLREQYESGQLSDAGNALFKPIKPVEELYDCQADPWEINNLVDDPALSAKLLEMRNAHFAWIEEIHDLGFIPEDLLQSLRQSAGTEWDVGHANNGAAVREAHESARLWERGAEAIPDMLSALTSTNGAVRYWAAMGLGTLAAQDVSESVTRSLFTALSDSEDVVRIAAARSLVYLTDSTTALQTLVTMAKSDSVSDLAMRELDMMGSLAKPVQSDIASIDNSRLTRRTIDTIDDTPQYPSLAEPPRNLTVVHTKKKSTVSKLKTIDVQSNNGEIEVTLPPGSSRYLQLINPQGRVVQQVKIEAGKGMFTFKRVSAARGVYTVRAIVENQIVTRNIVLF